LHTRGCSGSGLRGSRRGRVDQVPRSGLETSIYAEPTFVISRPNTNALLHPKGVYKKKIGTVAKEPRALLTGIVVIIDIASQIFLENRETHNAAKGRNPTVHKYF
jgi:hypothetical protein